MTWPTRTVLCNGVFDILHAGHVEHLKEARKMGDRLIVALTIDDKVNKGANRPINTWSDRAYLLRELRCVDKVIACSSASVAIRHVKPYFFVKGIDYAKGNNWTEDIKAVCGEVGTLIRFTKAPKMSATDIIKKAVA